LAGELVIKVVAKLKLSIANGFRKQEDMFDYNKDAGMFVCLGDSWLSENLVSERKASMRTK